MVPPVGGKHHQDKEMAVPTATRALHAIRAGLAVADTKKIHKNRGKLGSRNYAKTIKHVQEFWDFVAAELVRCLSNGTTKQTEAAFGSAADVEILHVAWNEIDNEQVRLPVYFKFSNLIQPASSTTGQDDNDETSNQVHRGSIASTASSGSAGGRSTGTMWPPPRSTLKRPAPAASPSAGKGRASKRPRPSGDDDPLVDDEEDDWKSVPICPGS